MAPNTPISRPTGQSKLCQTKLIFLGEPAVGKSSLIDRFVRGQFHDRQESSIGALPLTQTICLDETTIKFEIWDMIGQQRYQSQASTFYRGAQAAIVVYDLTNKNSFIRAKAWVKELHRHANPDIVTAMAGNKIDLSAKRAVEFAEANDYATENGLLFLETSAKTAINVTEIYSVIAKKLAERTSRFFVFANGNSPVIKNVPANFLLEEFNDDQDEEIEWSDHEDLKPCN